MRVLSILFMCLYLNKWKSQKKLILQKNKKLPRLYFFENYLFLTPRSGFTYLCVRNLIYLELKILKFIFRKLRKIIKKKKIKAFIYICCNYAFFKKSKNSRMGRGKGRFTRFAFVTKNIKPLLIFRGISRFRLFKFLCFMNTMFNHFYLF